mgnify:CR=1 FL=1|jgi:hypothetical protein
MLAWTLLQICRNTSLVLALICLFGGKIPEARFWILLGVGLWNIVCWADIRDSLGRKGKEG